MSTPENIDSPVAGEGLIAAIHSLSHKLMLLYAQIVFDQTGLNWQDWRILRAVVSLQSCRAQDICEECGLQKPHVSNGLTLRHRLDRKSRPHRTISEPEIHVVIVGLTLTVLSNPRYALTYVGFQDRCIQPLCHSSDGHSSV